MNLSVIFYDQLSIGISSLKNINKKEDYILICENENDFTDVKHHKKKIALIISAMRHFKEQLEGKGFNVIYKKIDDKKNTHSYLNEIKLIKKKYVINIVNITKPSSYTLYNEVKTWSKVLGCPINILPDNRFIVTEDEFRLWAGDKKELRMEFFYRELRKKFKILMDNDKPVGGKWNYDSENRKVIKNNTSFPKIKEIKHDQITKDVLKLVNEKFSSHFGDLHPFNFAVTRNQALGILRVFIKERLYNFGDFQDAMLEGEPLLFHSHISFYLNLGLLTPLECIRLVEDEYYNNSAPLNSVEGFIRQILGWREFVRGIYWLKMPGYEKLNFLNATRKMPSFFWNNNTNMNCLYNCIKETKENAYAHHIQRLMVLGNFFLISGINPKDVNEWYHIVYADAYQWVELPNVSGMILFADGGYLSSKPYAASGSYINKMSNYCKNCHYDYRKKEGEEACPFNYLYWNFLIKNKRTLDSNHRMRMIYSTLSKMDNKKIKTIKHDSKLFLERLSENEKI